tara:strand:+ start:627 stop:908 length:282 start_codon:yes stop_codon:yes gene_type:complete
MIPDKVKLIKSKNQLQFYYQNGICLILNGSFLRAASPSAENKNSSIKPNAQKFTNVKIEMVEKVGNYALRIIFSDGHNTGIFSWDYILEISKK